MPYNLLLLPLLGGFLFLHFSHIFRFRSQHTEGYRMLTEAAIAGFCLLLVARVLGQLGHTFVSAATADALLRSWKKFSPFEYSFTGVVSFALGPVLASGLNFVVNREKALDREIEKRGNALTQLFHQAQKRKKPISITLDNRKWYVGYTAESPNLNPRELYFRLLPILSGYQEQDTLEVVKTVSYEDLTQDAEIDVNDLIITIQLKDIKTANLFDESIFESYFAGSDEQPSDEEVTALVSGEDPAA